MSGAIMRSPNLLQRASGAVFRSIERPLWNATYRLTGRRIQSPMHIDEMAMYAGVFAADAAAVQRRLPVPDLRVVELEPGRAELQVVALDYRRVRPLPPYRELAVAVPVDRRVTGGGPERGLAILAMPVTTEDARWAGIVNFGFPKTLAEIEVVTRPGGVEATVSADGVEVLTLEVDEMPLVRQASRRITFTLRDDRRLIASDFTAEGRMGVSAEPGGARLVLGPHAIAADLRAMGIELESRGHLFAPELAGMLSKGRVVGEPAAASASVPSRGIVTANVVP